MNLLFLISSLDRGGAETHLVSLAAHLSKNGHSVTVLSSGGALTKELSSLGIVHQILPLHSRSPVSLLYSYRSIKKMLSSTPYDLIHAHARIPSFLVARTAKKKKIPLLTTVHAKFRVTPLLRRCSRWGDYSIAVSEDLRQYLCEHYSLSSERIAVIPNGIDTAHFSPAPQKVPRTAERIVYLSRLDEDCSAVAFLLCELAPMLRARFPTLEIVLGGGGAALPKLKEASAEINRCFDTPAIRLTGHLDDPRPLFWNADCVIGVSRVALEASSCGIPVLLAGNEGFLGLLTRSLLPKASETNFCCRGARKLTKELLFDAICEFLSTEKAIRDKQASLLSLEIRRQYKIEAIAKETLLVYRSLCEEAHAKGSADLILCGYYGDGNTGDHALLRAAIQRAKKEHPSLSLCAVTAHGKKDEPQFGIRCIRRRSTVSLLRSLRSAKLLVFGGGTLLQDRTSLRSLCYYAFLLHYAARHGVACELWANGIAPPRSRLAKHLIRRSLLCCQRIGLRDRLSLALVQELCSDQEHAPTILEADLAQATPPADDRRIRFLLARFGLLSEDGIPRSFAVIAPYGAAAAGQCHILRHWIKRQLLQGVHPVFLPLFPKEDLLLCERFAREYHGTLLRGLSECDLVGMMRCARVVASMRLHGLIFAKCASVPFVGFGDDPKIEAFCREHGGRRWSEEL